MAAANSLPTNFRDSYLARDSYPLNVIDRSISTYPSALAEYRRRLDDAADDLCEPDISKVDVSFRDLHIQLDDRTWKELEKRNIHSPAGLQNWLGIKAVLDENGDETTVSVTKRDPKCRFIYLWGQHSRSRLQITRSMLVEILSFHQVMPDYLDHLFLFGRKVDQGEIGFTSFREQMSFRGGSASHCNNSLGRSGKQYQLCYNLKGVKCIHNDPDDPIERKFSIRQAAIYHRFDVVSGNTVWIVTQGRLDLYERFKELTGKNARPEDRAFQTPEECLRSSLSAHLLFCHWAAEEWRAYIKWLEDIIERKTKLAVVGRPGERYSHRVATAQENQDLLLWVERFSEAVTVFSSNIDIMSSLSDFYRRLSRNPDSGPASTCQDDIEVFSNDLGNIINSFKLHVNRTKTLEKILKDRIDLARQRRLEWLNKNMESEAIVVRIVTIVTLIYLPATFTSTFFSTDIIKYQDQESPGGKFSQVAMNRWLQVTIPLTILTLVLAYASSTWAEKASHPEDSDHGYRRNWLKRYLKMPWDRSLTVRPLSTEKLYV